MKQLEALQTLLDCYLHEDWKDDYPDFWHAVDDFIDGEPEWAPHFSADVQHLLGDCSTEQEIEQRLRELGSVYNPLGVGWESNRTWLLAVAAHVEAKLHTSPAA